MILNIDKLSLNKKLEAFTIENNIEQSSSPRYIFRASCISRRHWYCVTKDGTWAVSQKHNYKNIITQFNFISSELNYISDLFFMVDYSKDLNRFLVYKDIQPTNNIKIDAKGIFNTEYILCEIDYEQSKRIYDKYWELKVKLK